MSKQKQPQNARLSREERYLQELKKELLAFFEVNEDATLSPEEVFQRLEVQGRSRQQLYQILLEELAEEQQLVAGPDGRYGHDNGLRERTGRLEHSSRNFGFVVSEEAPGDDVKVAADDLGGAIDGDRVRVSVWQGSKRGGRKPEGRIVEVLERGRRELVGTFEATEKGFGFVVPDNRRLYEDFYVRPEDLGGAQNGQKVILEITRYPEAGRKPEGRITTVLGMAGDNDTEMHAILAEFGLPNAFPEAVEAEAEAIPDAIEAVEVARRRDFRGITTLTIDPADAKDFDDALSIEFLDNGNVEIGVHIADVTHYVRPDSALEQEAYRRATSVYLVDRTVPMLPERLSNGLCSLRPNEEKLTFSAVFELDLTGRLVAEWFGRTVIYSGHRFAYEEAQALLETPDDAAAPALTHELHVMNTIAKKMREQRFSKGAINFETVEVKFRLDADGRPLEVYQKERKDAHKLIEEYMLLANKRVAEFVFNQRKKEPRNTMVYRVHQAPDPDRLQVFAEFARRFGYDIELENNVAQSLNRMMHTVEGRPEQNILENLAVRTMAKARYSTEPIGHFGLAFAHYTHFTSPIRRYPDMMAHRLLQHYLDGGHSVEQAACEARCKHSSDREKLAAEAERASIKYKQVEFMAQRVGQEFDGLISGVTEFGIFVEMTDTASEGMVRLTDLRDDYYELDRENYRLVGQRTGRMLSFGDAVRVRVKETSLAKRSIDLELLGTLHRNDQGDMALRAQKQGGGDGGRGRSGSSRGRQPSAQPASAGRKQNTSRRGRK